MDNVFEGLIVIVGLCITFFPVICFIKYLMNRVKVNTDFDNHVRLVNDKKGSLGVAIAYVNKVILSMTICSLGIFMSSFFENEIFGEIFIISLILYLIVNYIDNYDEK